MRANIRQYFFRKNNTQGFSHQSRLIRIFLYSGIFINLLLPFYNYQTNSFGWWEDSPESDPYFEAENNIRTMNLTQSEFYLEYGKFSSSLQELPLDIRTETNWYSYRIVSPMVPVQVLNDVGKPIPTAESVMMIAQAKYPRLNSYIGMVSILKEKDTHKARPISRICEINGYAPLPSTMPILADGKIQCPKDSP